MNQGGHDELHRVSVVGVHTVFVLAAAVAGSLVLAGKLVLSLFGDEFVSAYGAIRSRLFRTGRHRFDGVVITRQNADQPYRGLPSAPSVGDFRNT